MKLNAIQKRILKAAISNHERYGISQPITALSEDTMCIVDDFIPAQAKYFKSIHELIEADVLFRSNVDGYAYINDYDVARGLLA